MTTLRFEGGGHAEIVSIEPQGVVLASSVAAPPGATLSAQSEVGSLLVKVRSCRRGAGELGFRIEGRFVNLSRLQRERLSAERGAS